MTALASKSFENNTEVTEDNASDISEEIDELAGDLDPIMEADATNKERPNNVSFDSNKSGNKEKKQQEEEDDDNDNIYEIEKIVDHRTYRVLSSSFPFEI